MNSTLHLLLFVNKAATATISASEAIILYTKLYLKFCHKITHFVPYLYRLIQTRKYIVLLYLSLTPRNRRSTSCQSKQYNGS